MLRPRTLVVFACLAAACSRPIQTARTSSTQPLMAAEAAARARQTARRCSDTWALLFPGMGQMCLGKDGPAAALMTLGAAELGTAVAVGRRQGWDHPGAVLPLLGFQDLWIYDNSDLVIERALANQALYAPQDSLADLVAAPFNAQVLERADVWAGTLLTVGVGISASLLFGGDLDTRNAGSDPNLFGYQVDGRVGYPLGVSAGAALFTHVAVAEETLFRGTLQSGIARRSGERAGWLWGSALFGAAHSLNALFLPADQRVRYIAVAVPLITGIGAYMGHTYRRSGYSLSVPVAIHFWYDLLLSTTFFALDPQNSPLSASISIPF